MSALGFSPYKPPVNDSEAYFRMLQEDAQIKHRMPGKQIEQVLKDGKIEGGAIDEARKVLQVSAVKYLAPLLENEFNQLRKVDDAGRKEMGLQQLGKNDLQWAWEWLYASTNMQTRPASYDYPEKGSRHWISSNAVNEMEKGLHAVSRISPYLVAARAKIDESKLIEHLRETLKDASPSKALDEKKTFLPAADDKKENELPK